MQTKSRIKNKGRAVFAGLVLALVVPGFQSVRAEGEISAEEQRLRDLFLKVREDNRKEGQAPQTPPAPKPAPPKATPPPPRELSAPPSPSKPAPPKPAVRPVTRPSAPTPRPSSPPSPAAGENTRFGHGSPPLPTPAPRSQAPRPKPEVAAAPSPPKAAPKPTPRPPREDAAPLGDKLRTLAGNLKERLSSLPRTEQSRAMEIAESHPTPRREEKPEMIPVRKTEVTPPTIARKPATRVPAPVLKISPEVPEPAPVSPDPAASPSEQLIAKATRSMREIDTDSLLDDPNRGLKVDGPTDRESLSATAEAIRRSLLEDEPAGAKTPTKPETPVIAATPKPPVSASPPPPLARASTPAATSAGGMTGAVFERVVRQAMAFGMTTVIATKAAPTRLPEPEISTEAPGSASAPPVVTSLPDPEDDIPEYAKAARELGGSLDALPPVPDGNRPPGLNDFVISATHQTDFDMESSSITFAGHVVVESSRFHLTCDKFIVHMLPDQKGMDFGEAIGNVVIRMMEMRKPTGHTGLARSAIYRPQKGEITLSGWPRIVEETKELVGITADAQMVLTTSGSVRTIGRNRTILKQ